MKEINDGEDELEVIWDTGAPSIAITSHLAKVMKQYKQFENAVIIPQLSVKATNVNSDEDKKTIIFKNVPAVVNDQFASGGLLVGGPLLRCFEHVIIGNKDDKDLFCVTLSN